ncbi:LamG domain-containing protein [Mucilaginibacter sp. dw_454]|uniref:LamG domain-containing protein n=1 Tax=Mucilaginibacter sp. dw_454 TaxID=2720079 RepID=UPI001BD3908E|nr:LamG domain-containing protein [Mucilaginibacter sp. dw_454]
MKRLKKLVTVAVLLAAVITIFQACKKTEETRNTNSDKSKLTLQIDSANTLYSSAVEGKQAGDYTAGSKAVLKASIDLASGVVSGAFTQQEVNNATSNLVRAEAAFRSNLIQEVSPANLVAYWKFSGDATDASGNGHDGTLKTNYVGTTAATATDGGTLPVLTTDRYGAANSAYAFNNGAYIEVPYTQSLYPSSFSISVWVKPTKASDGNYIFSVDHYFGYKFQLQGSNFPFLTVSTDAGIHDVDDNPGAVTLNTWSQVVATFTSGTITFYINGKLVKTVATTGNLIAPKTIVNVCIGNELPKSAYNFTDTSNPNYFYGASYFQGSLDDIRLYNKVLSDAEVNSLYVMEQP